MRKLSEIMAPIPMLENGYVPSWQGLVLFDKKVLDADKVISSEEVGKMLTFFYGQKKLSAVSTANLEEFLDWVEAQLYKALTNDRVMGYPIDTPLSKLAVKGFRDGGECSGPLRVLVFQPDEGMENDLLVLTCRWEDGGFKNDHYIIGVIGDNDDLIRTILDYIKKS